MARVGDQTIINAWIRQDGICAICGEPLIENAYEVHHMQRKTDGGSDSDENIALLCDRDEHEYVHGGNFNEPVQTTAEQYPYFYGRSQKLEFQETNNEEAVDEVEDISTVDDNEKFKDYGNEGGSA